MLLVCAVQRRRMFEPQAEDICQEETKKLGYVSNIIMERCPKLNVHRGGHSQKSERCKCNSRRPPLE